MRKKETNKFAKEIVKKFKEKILKISSWKFS